MRKNLTRITLLLAPSLASAQQFTIRTLAGGAGSPSVPALAASIGQPQRIAIDAAGAVYFSNLNAVFKIDSTGALILVAGSSQAGFEGDGGPATQAQLNSPQGIALDTAGNVFIADRNNHRVREVTPDGKIATVAGNGTAGFFGDGGTATDAELNLPTGLALDSIGNVYVADPGTHSVRELLTDGTIITAAGNSQPGYSGYFGDGGAAIDADLLSPEGLAVDSAGNLYIADPGAYVVRQVSGGVITTLAGNNTIGFSGDGGKATSAQLDTPYDVAVDTAGNVYILEYTDNRVRKVTKGIITTIAGNGSAGFAGDGGSATSAQLLVPRGLASDGAGNLFIADSGNDRVRKISTSGTISTIAGSGSFRYSGDGGPAASAQFNGPQGVAIDSAGDVYVSDTNNHRVRVISPQGVITTLAGSGAPGFSGDGNAAGGAQLNLPSGLAVDAAGAVYVADYGNNRVRKISPDGVITTVAGNGSPGYSGDGGAAIAASLYGPAGVTIDKSGALYIAEFDSGRVRKVSPGGLISTVAGNGVAAYGGDGGLATAAYLKGPSTVAIDAAGDLFIADTLNNAIREVTPDGFIFTIAGTGIAGYSGDGGPAVNAQLLGPAGVALDPAGNLYITEASNHIRVVSPDGTITTGAGAGVAGYAGDGGPAADAQLNGPSQITVDSAGSVYFAESGSNVVRVLALSK